MVSIKVKRTVYKVKILAIWHATQSCPYCRALLMRLKIKIITSAVPESDI